MKMLKITSFIPFLLVALLSGCGPYGSPQKPAPKAVGGVLDLSSWDFDRDGPVKLDGAWEFYWRELLNPQDFETGKVLPPTGFIPVPSIWNGQVLNGTHLTGKGYGTYRLIIRVPARYRYYGIKLMTFSSAYRLYANGHPAASAGVVGISEKDSIAQHLPGTAFFSIDDTRNGTLATVEILAQVSNSRHPKGGFWYSAYFGSSRQIQAMRESRVGLEMFFIGIFVIIAFYHFVLYVLRRKNSYVLFFGLFCIAMALRTSLMGENLWMALFPGFPWEWKVKLEMLTFYASTPLFTAFFFRFYYYPGKFSRPVNTAVQVCGFLFGSVLLITPYSFSYPMLRVYMVITTACAAYILYVLTGMFKTRRAETLVFLVGFIAMFSTVVHDFLAVNQVIYTGPLFPFGLAIFILSQSVMISIQSARAFTTAETLTNELEKKVNERTNELEIERNSLKERNEIIERDLEMARNIQLKLVPAECQIPSVAFYYKPMDKIGGDFYDFIYYHNPEKLGIFISDVSGHGVSAAFITSMIKTVILQAGPLREDPAGLMAHLNEILLTPTGGSFVTAFFGILDVTRRELVFANAGHNHPYLLYPDRIEALGQKGRAIPLAIRDNGNLRKHNRFFLNETVDLKGCRKLFFYTDGLTESRNIGEYLAARKREKEEGIIDYKMDDFETAGLAAALMDNRGESPAAFIKNLFDRLVKFRGCDYFEDDICMICVDLPGLSGTDS